MEDPIDLFAERVEVVLDPREGLVDAFAQTEVRGSGLVVARKAVEVGERDGIERLALIWFSQPKVRHRCLASTRFFRVK